MNRRFTLLVAALALLTIPQLAGAQTQVPVDYFQQPNVTLINFDTDPGLNPLASGQLLQNVYSSWGVTFDANDQATAFDAFGTSAPNQASGSADDLQDINIYFDRGVDAVGAWGYDFVLRAFDQFGVLIMEVDYTDGRPCPIPGSFREQRFLGIAGDRPIFQAQFSRYFQDQVDCGFRIDDFYFLQQPLPPLPTPIDGNVQISWGNCSGYAGSAPFVTFDCDPMMGSQYDLVGTFQVNNAFNNFVAMDISMDVILDGMTSVPDFWHFELGGCNNNGLIIGDSKPVTCGLLTPWGPGGSESDAFITGYQAGYGFPNYGRLLATVARASDNPTNLAAAPSRYYGWTMSFLMDNANTCTGCNLPASIRVNGAVLFDTGGGAGYLISGNAIGSLPCVSINGGGSACNPVATKKSTWGQLKSLYR